MSNYNSRITNFVEGKNELEVRDKLVTLGIELQQKLEVINVYYNSGKGRVIAWYFHDTKVTPLPPVEKEVKKVTKKKASKKKVK